MFELPEPYETTRQELLERDRPAFKGWPEDMVTDMAITRNKCTWWAKTFHEKHPELTKVRGFFHSTEHVWFTTELGEIIDPTRAQFGESPDNYRVFDPETDHIYLGKCPNCGEAQYGLEKDGPKDLCDEECAEAYGRYITREAARL